MQIIRAFSFKKEAKCIKIRFFGLFMAFRFVSLSRLVLWRILPAAATTATSSATGEATSSGRVAGGTAVVAYGADGR